MPHYDYLCSECGHRFVKFQDMVDGKLRKCPECGKLKLVRLIGAGSGVLFRGDGFPSNDLRRKKQGEKWKPQT